jgi:hypothetical protein
MSGAVDIREQQIVGRGAALDVFQDNLVRGHAR